MFSAAHIVGGLAPALDSGTRWMMDNNQFTGDFTFYRWMSQLIKYHKYRDTCLGIPIPDEVGDALATLQMFGQYYAGVRDLGYPVAFVSQNGITPAITPWDLFDVLFVGGDDAHKLGPEAGLMIAEAKNRRKWVHVGRVNSYQRITQFWMADSVDGSGLIRDAGGQRAERLASYSAAIQYANAKNNGNVTATNQYGLGV